MTSASSARPSVLRTRRPVGQACWARVPENDSIWNLARSEGFEVSSFDRNVASNEKQVAVAIATQILEDSFQYMNPGDKVALVSGDRDYLPVVNSLNRRASTRPVAFCQHATGKNLKQPPVSYFGLDDSFDYLARWNSGSRGGSNCRRSALPSDAEATARTSGSEAWQS